MSKVLRALEEAKDEGRVEEKKGNCQEATA